MREMHGGTGSRLFSIRKNMISRCYKEYNRLYHRYGGRGIAVCAEWRNSFSAFRDWALEGGYRDDLTLDRIDNDGGYGPSNCRWSTRREQSNNMCRNRTITHNGKTKTVSEWARAVGIPASTIRARMGIPWMDTSDILSTTPFKSIRRKSRLEGEIDAAV